jgi:hypothetical protein
MGWGWEPLKPGSSPDRPSLSLSSLTSEGRVLIHFGGALTGAEEESVLVPVGEHREAATAGRLAPGEEGKGLASGCSPGCLASPQTAWPSSLRIELSPWIWAASLARGLCLNVPRAFPWVY